MSRGRDVAIAGRTFTLGAAYAPRSGDQRSKPRRLLHYAADSLLAGGRVHVAPVPSGHEHVMAGTQWAAWAGEEVEDGPWDIGR